MPTATATLGSLVIDMPVPARDFGTEALRALADLAASAVCRMADLIAEREIPPRIALVSRIRGTGPGVSFGLLVRATDVRHGVPYRTPFEGSPNVAGAVLELREILGGSRDDAFLRLRFAPGTTDLPMHVHEHSDRFVYVVRGRGFFHVAPDALEDFDGERRRQIAVRTRDVLVFPRNTVHTFSTAATALELLSYHAPHIPLDDPRQYTLPPKLLYPGLLLRPADSRIACDSAWSVLG